MIKLLRKPAAGSLLAILAAMLVGGIILTASGHNPFRVYIGLIQGAMGNPRFIVNTIVTSTSLILTGLSVTFAYKAGLFNIGIEGQFIIGTVAAVHLGYHLNLPPVIHPAVVMLGAMLVSGLFGAIIGYLKAKFNIHEVLSSIMLNWIAFYLHNLYVGIERFQGQPTVAHQIRNSANIIFFNSMKSNPQDIVRIREFGPTISDIILRTNINFGIFIAVAAVFLIKFILDKTTLGYTLKAVGFNKEASEAAGINVSRYTVLSMFIAGALAGLGAAVHIMGISPNTISALNVFQNHGFNGIPVALLANAGVVLNIFSALLFGGMNNGSSYIQSNFGVATEIIDIVVGLIVFFVGLRIVCLKLADRLEKKKKEEINGHSPLL